MLDVRGTFHVVAALQTQTCDSHARKNFMHYFYVHGYHTFEFAVWGGEALVPRIISVRITPALALVFSKSLCYPPSPARSPRP